MSSLKQIEANRRNARNSTGPTTSQGKQRSRCNAVRHGLTAETVIARLEDADDYEAFQAAVISDYDAETAVERELALRLASVLWRLRRANGIETALFEAMLDCSGKHECCSARATLAQIEGFSERTGGYEGAAQVSAVSERSSLGLNAKRDLAECYFRLAELPTSAHDRLSRYEYMLWRQARQIVSSLELLRRRNRQPSRPTPPIPIPKASSWRRARCFQMKARG